MYIMQVIPRTVSNQEVRTEPDPRALIQIDWIIDCV